MVKYQHPSSPKSIKLLLNHLKNLNRLPLIIIIFTAFLHAPSPAQAQTGSYCPASECSELDLNRPCSGNPCNKEIYTEPKPEFSNGQQIRIQETFTLDPDGTPHSDLAGRHCTFPTECSDPNPGGDCESCFVFPYLNPQWNITFDLSNTSLPAIYNPIIQNRSQYLYWYLLKNPIPNPQAQQTDASYIPVQPSESGSLYKSLPATSQNKLRCQIITQALNTQTNWNQNSQNYCLDTSQVNYHDLLVYDPQVRNIKNCKNLSFSNPQGELGRRLSEFAASTANLHPDCYIKPKDYPNSQEYLRQYQRALQNWKNKDNGIWACLWPFVPLVSLEDSRAEFWAFTDNPNHTLKYNSPESSQQLSLPLIEGTSQAARQLWRSLIPQEINNPDDVIASQVQQSPLIASLLPYQPASAHTQPHSLNPSKPKSTNLLTLSHFENQPEKYPAPPIPDRNPCSVTEYCQAVGAGHAQECDANSPALRQRTSPGALTDFTWNDGDTIHGSPVSITVSAPSIEIGPLTFNQWDPQDPGWDGSYWQAQTVTQPMIKVNPIIKSPSYFRETNQLLSLTVRSVQNPSPGSQPVHSLLSLQLPSSNHPYQTGEEQHIYGVPIGNISVSTDHPRAQLEPETIQAYFPQIGNILAYWLCTGSQELISQKCFLQQINPQPH